MNPRAPCVPGWLPSPSCSSRARARGGAADHARSDNPSFNGTVNTMMYTAVTVDSTAATRTHGRRRLRVRGRPHDLQRHHRVEVVERAVRHDRHATWTLLLHSGQVLLQGRAGGSHRAHACGALATTAAPTPTLPTNLSYLNLQYRSPRGVRHEVHALRI
jgi:hypothetical protein